MIQSDFLPGSLAPSDFKQAYWFLFDGVHLFVQNHQSGADIPLAASVGDIGFVPKRIQFVGCLGETACFSAEIEPPTQLPENGEFCPLRPLHGRLADPFFWIAGRALQLVEWDRTHQYCGKCGTPVTTGEKEHVKICPACDHRCYPRISPAVIVAVTKADKLLLAHNRRHRAGMYTVLAGFVEAGETLEETVQREIKEEVGIDVTNIRYFGSQPWAFPNSLMIAFTAEWAGGDFVFVDDDIEVADWFSAETLPVHPTGPSIAHALIQHFLDSQASLVH